MSDNTVFFFFSFYVVCLAQANLIPNIHEQSLEPVWDSRFDNLGVDDGDDDDQHRLHVAHHDSHHWEKGPNVCVKEVEVPEPHDLLEFLRGGVDYDHYKHHSSTCHEEEEGDALICHGRKYQDGIRVLYTKRYECCPGFVRRHQLNNYKEHHHDIGCYEVDVKNLIPTLRDLKGVRFVQLAETFGLAELLHNENFTIFCPPDDSLDSLIQKQEEKMNEIISDEFPYSSDEFLQQTMASHMIQGFFRYDDVNDEAVLDTENPGAKIRIDIYYIPHKLATANCVPVTSSNHLARNGVVHLVERVLPIPSRTVADIIASDPDFSILKGMLSKAGLVQVLRNPAGNFTVYAPTDSAFRFHSELLEEFQTGRSCISSLMKNHILEHVICSSAIPSYAQSLNMLDELLTLTREVDNKIYVNNVQVVVRDLVGTNGVVHIIDGLLVPRQAKVVSQVLEETRLIRFLELLNHARMKTAFDKMENVTFFVPSNDATMKFLRSKRERILDSNETLQDILRYHAAKTEFLFDNTDKDEILKTHAEHSNLRIRQYNMFPHFAKQVTVQCARVLSANNRLCGSVLHVIDRLLLPSTSNIMVTLDTTPELAYFAELVRVARLEYTLTQRNKSFTILAPINDIFQHIPFWFLDDLKRDMRKAREFVKMHILSDTLCCDQLVHTFVAGRRQVRAIDGSLFGIVALVNAPMRIGDARIVECDKMADNGVVHLMDNFVYFHRGLIFNERTSSDNLRTLL